MSAGIGCYDGAIGPGTGSFLQIAFQRLLGLGLANVAGSAGGTRLAMRLSDRAVRFVLTVAVLATVAKLLIDQLA